MSELRIRKSVADLSQTDLEDYPVWEFALDEEDLEGQDETTVRPWSDSGPVDPSAGMFVVRARFVLADGTAMTGYLTPTVEDVDRLASIQPIIVTDEGQVLFWCGIMSPSADDLARNYRRLGKHSPAQVFPIRFHADVAIAGGSVEGEIPAFIVLEDFTTAKTRNVK
jgi:hypothetical protein